MSVVIVPPPNGLVLLLEPSERFVTVPEPNFCVVPVTVFPPLSRSVVIVPPPNGLVVPLEPSERFVIVPEPNFCVVPVRGPDGGSAANEQVAADRIAKWTASDVSIFDIIASILVIALILAHQTPSECNNIIQARQQHRHPYMLQRGMRAE